MLISELCDKVIGIWGLGREGNAVWDYLKKHNIGKEIKVFTNDDEVNLNGVDVVIKSPGVSMYKPEIIEAKKNGVKFTSSSDLFLSEMRANKPNCKVIGISGSKGKSTSVSAMHHMLSAMGYKVGLGGNIGRPIIELLDDDYDYVVGEFSSYQAADLTCSPHIVIYTNLFYVHTNWHNHSHEQYCLDKMNLSANQQAGDVIFANKKNPQLCEYVSAKNLQWYNEKNTFHAEERDLFWEKTKLLNIADLKLSGNHNLDNLAGVFAVLQYLGMDIKKAAEVLQSFEPLEHRLQNFVEKNGIKFINDSISTAPEAAIGAMKSFEENIVIISGGQYLEQNYQEYAEYVANNPKIKMVAAMYQSGPKIAEAIKDKVKREGFVLLESNDMEKVVSRAYQLLQEKGQGGYVLFSPTAPSFGVYKNFMERGQHFMTTVKNLLEKEV